MVKTRAGDIVGTAAPIHRFAELSLTFMRIGDVQRVTGLPRATIYEMMGKGTFPKQVRLSPRAVGWIESEVSAWQRDRIAERDGVEGEAA
jgi:prophage regulatory protein